MDVVPTVSGSEESLDYARNAKGLAIHPQIIDFKRARIVQH